MEQLPQTSIKKRIKKHIKQLNKKNTKTQPKGSQKVTKTRPTREGKGGIQDGILLEKKRMLRNETYCGKGCMQEGNTQTVTEGQHAPASGLNPARGRISVAKGNSSAPGPRGESVRTERLQSNKKRLQNVKISPKVTKMKPKKPKWNQKREKGPQLEPQGHQNGAKRVQRGAKSNPKDPNWSHKGGQMGPKGPNMEPKVRQREVLDRFVGAFRRVVRAWTPRRDPVQEEEKSISEKKETT